MSHFTQAKTKISNREALVRALTRKGFRRDQIELHDTDIEITDYYGQRRKASIILRRNVLGIPSDMGFHKEEDGNYSLIFDDFKYGGKNYGKDWQQSLFQLANVETVKIEYASRGITYEESKDQNGNIILIADTDEEERDTIKLSI
jgi:hypothetical protein